MLERLKTGTAIAAAAAAGAYLDAKYYTSNDIEDFRNGRNLFFLASRLVQQNKVNFYYLFEEAAADKDHIFLTFAPSGETSLYGQAPDEVYRYANWSLSKGIRKGGRMIILCSERYCCA